MSTYRLFSWGANSHGQLGQGVLSEHSVLPQEVDLSECGLKPEDVRKIVGGGAHTLILDTKGRVYSCGHNDRKQIGVSYLDRTDVSTFHRVPLHDETAVDVCCGWDSSAALTKNGNLYLWGSNRYGQLGYNLSILSISSPICTIRSERVKRVSMGLRHTVVTTDSGKLLVCGANSKGQLGLVQPETEKYHNVVCRFTEVPGLTGITDVACGEHHTIVATQQEDAYITYFFGDNKHGQAELDPKTCPRVYSAYCSVHNYLRFEGPIEIHAGWSHTSMLKGGAVYSCGRNSYGQLGRENLEEKTQVLWKMQQVRELPRVVQLSVGSEHNVALTEDGEIFCWGWNEHGNCGNGDMENVMIPQRLAIPRNSIGVLIGTGAAHSLAVIKDNDYTCA